MTSTTMKATTYSDEAALVERAKRDPAAFGALYDRYVERIYGYAYREIRDVAKAQDVTAVTFEKALRHIGRFHWRDTGFAPWLYRIARNEIAQQYRREARVRSPVEEDEEALAGQAADREPRPIESAVLHAERDQGLQEALGRLDEADREVLTLRFLEQLPTEDVAQILQCSRNNVYVRLHRALGRLRDQLATEEK